MDNYGNDYFMSQEGYASIDFTLLDRPNSNIASAPESTAALLPDLHVADSSFSSFDFLDGPSVDAFGGVLPDADEAHSRDQGGFRSDLQKYKKERSLLQNSVALQRGDGPDSEPPTLEFHIPFEVQKPVSNLDFFSQGHTKESGNQEQQAHSDPGNDATDGNQDYFDQGQMSQETHPGAAGAGGWYSTWGGSNSQGDQTQSFFRTPSYGEASEERRLMQMKGNSSQLAGQTGYHTLSSPQVCSSDPVQKATHSFLPTANQSDSRQASNIGLGLPNTQVNTAPSPVVKSSPRNQPFDYEVLMNGSPANQFRQNSSAAVENTASAQPHQTSDANLGGQDVLPSHAQSQNYKYAGQNIGSLAPAEVSPLKVNDYDFLGGQYVLKGQTQGEIGQQLAVEDMQAWHQHPLLSQSSQQQASYQPPYQDLSRHQQHHVNQQSQHARQQHLQQFLAVNHPTQSLGNQLSAFLSDSSLQDLPRVAERQNSQLAVDNPSALQTNYQPMNNMTNLNWSASDPSAMEGLAHDYLMGADQNFNWQALALKASQVDPTVYGSLPVNRRDTAGQPLSAYSGMQGGVQEFYSGLGKLTAPNAQAGKPVARNLGSRGSVASIYRSDYQAEVYDAAPNLQTGAHSSKHQALGKMPFWQNPYPQSVEQSRSGNHVNQANLPPRSPQVPSTSQVRQQRNWSGLSGQQETLQGGVFAQNLANVEALKQSILAGSSVQQNSHQGANPRPSGRTHSIEAAHYIQQSSSQSASGSHFLSTLGTKQLSKWNRLTMQQSVPQTGVPAETPSSLENNHKSNWTSLNIQQASAETQSLSNLKQQNIWSGHNAQQSSRPAAGSLHLFTDLDGRRSNIHSGHDLQQGIPQPSGSQQVGKIDVNLHNSRSIQSSSVQGNEPPNTLLDLDASQQSGWRDHSLLQGTRQTSNSLQAYNDLDKTSSWRSIWQTPPSVEGSSQLLELDDGRQQNTLWGHSLQKSSSQAVEAQVATINSREQGSWSGEDVQQESPQTAQLSCVDAEQQGSHHSHSSDIRHQSGQFGHLLHEEHTRVKTSAELDARHKASQSAYNLQSQSGTVETDARHKAGQNAYNFQSQVGTAETDVRHKASLNAYKLQSQVGTTETDARHKVGRNTYNVQSQVGITETDARHKASQNACNLQSQVGMTETDSRHKDNQNAYSLQSQVGVGETDNRHKGNLSVYNLQSQLATVETETRYKATQSAYAFQSQVGTGEPDARHKAGQNAFSMQSQLGAGEKDHRHRSSQNSYNLQSQVGTVETDAYQKGRQNTYNLQSQVGAAEADVRHKESQDAHSLQAQVGAYSQPSNIDGRQGRSQWPHSLQHGSSQAGTSMYVYPNMSTNNQSTQNSLNLHAWNASINSVESWQKSTASGHFQQMDLSQVENVDTRQQSTQSGNNTQHTSPQNENHPQSLNNSRPPRRLGRLNSSQDISLRGAMGAITAKPATTNLWQIHGSNIGLTCGSQRNVLTTWSEGQNLPGRGDVEKFNLGGESTSAPSSDVLPAWSHRQSFSAQQGVDQASPRGESVSGPKEVPLTWPHRHNSSAQTDVDQPNCVGESRTGTNEVQLTWSQGQNLVVRKDVEEANLVGESNSGVNLGVNKFTPVWSRGQNGPAEKEVEQLSLGGESNSEMNEEALPAWSRGQSALTQKDVEESDRGGDSINGKNDLPIWSRGQNSSTQYVVDQLNLGVESNSGRNEGFPARSHGQNPHTLKDAEQFNLTGGTNRGGSEDEHTWSHGQSTFARKDVEQLDFARESNIEKPDSQPAWSHGQNVLSQKDAEQLNQAGDSNSGGTSSSGKDLLNSRIEAEKRAHLEISLLDGRTLRESNSAASPAPSPESNLFSSVMKQKPSTKVSSLSRNTLELLSKPEEPNESSSMIDEDEEEEELDLEDSGANASSISLAHLRRNQASGPLSPQGFGLRLAPPSHLSQNPQAGNSSRLVGSTSNLGADASRATPIQAGKEQLLSKPTVGSDQSLKLRKSVTKEDQLDLAVPSEVGTSGLILVTAAGKATAATATSQQDPLLRSQEFLSAEVAETTSGASALDGSTSHSATLSASDVKLGANQACTGAQHSAETAQSGAANGITPAQAMDSMVNMVSEDGNATSNSFSLSQASLMGHFTSSFPQKAQYPSLDLQVQQSGAAQTAVLSKLFLTFKDSLTGEAKQTSAQQQIGSAERGNAGVFEAFRPQVGKQVNGLQPAHWSNDPESVQAELFKRLAAQSQNKSNLTVFGQMTTSNGSHSEQTTVCSESLPGQSAGTGHYLSGQQDFGKGPVLPGQALASGQSHPGQPFHQGQVLPGQETTAALSQSYIQGGNMVGQGIMVDKTHSEYLYTHGHAQGLALPRQSVMPDQSQLVQLQITSGQASTPGQSYSGQEFPQGQALPVQLYTTGHFYPGQTYNASQGHSALPSTPGFSQRGSLSGQMFSQSYKLSGQSFTAGQGLLGPETPGPPISGQVISPTMANKQNKARQHGKIPQKAVGNDGNQIQREGEVIPQRSSGFPTQQSTGYAGQQPSDFQSQQALLAEHITVPQQYAKTAQENHLFSGTQASQDTAPSESQPASVMPEGLGSQEPRAGDSKKFEVTGKHGVMLGSRGGSDSMQVPPAYNRVEQFGARRDNQGDVLRQWPNAHSSSGLSDYQFQRILEGRPSLAAHLDMYKADPRLYHLAASQLRASLGHAHMGSHLGRYQQQARDQSAVSASTSVLRSSCDGATAAQVMQASQAAQATRVQGSHATQSVQASQDIHEAHTVQAAAQVHAAAQAVQVLQADQVAQAVEVVQAAQAVEAAQGVQAAQVPQSAIISKNASTAARLLFLSHFSQRGQNANRMAAPWFSGLAGRSSSNAMPFSSRRAECTSPDAAIASASAGVAVERLGNDDLSGKRLPQNLLISPQPPKKRKEYPALIPWREAVSQSGGYVSSTSASELEWASATNRTPDTEPYGEVIDTTDTRAVVISRAKRRLRLTTHLMQQITPPVPATFMQSKSAEDRKVATYTLSKLAFAEACQIASIACHIREMAAARDAEESRIKKEREFGGRAMKEADKSGESMGGPMLLVANIPDRFKLRMKNLENSLQRMETSPSAVDLVKNMQDTERLGLVNRLAVHHSSLNSLQNIDAPHKAVPQKYVTTVQMPNTLPEGLLCVSL